MAEPKETNTEKLLYDPEKNYDEATIAQQKDIEKQIADSQRLVGDTEDFTALTEEYVGDKVYLDKIESLHSCYTSMRRMRGDGNCFYRAFGFGYLEQLLQNNDECQRFRARLIEAKEELLKLGFPQFTIEDFHDQFLELVNKVEQNCPVEDLLADFNDQSYSDYYVVYLRLLVSGYLQKESDFYINFMEDGKTVKEFCNHDVEPMGRESDHIHIIALATSLNTCISVEYMDRGEGATSTQHTFPEGSQPTLFLLYRPGHYDLLYKTVQ